MGRTSQQESAVVSGPGTPGWEEAGGAPMRILYVGPLVKAGTCWQRMMALKDLGHEVVAIDSLPPEVWKADRRVWRRVRRKVLGIGPSDLCAVNEQILREVAGRAFDVLWMDKGLVVKRSTLERVRRVSPRTAIVGYSPDDMRTRRYQSRDFLKHLPLYDIYFTTKSYGVEELKALGCPRVVFVANAYDPAMHRPVEVTAEDRERLGGPVGFIGDYEAERAGAMTMLAREGIPVRVWGPNWGRFAAPHAGLRIEGRPVWGEDYAKAVCSFDIVLGFLKRKARDKQTTRSVEIPACGAFMLAERTDEHMELFREGVEAEFFASEGELLEKVRYYLANPEKRRAVAGAGRRRCVEGGYSNQGRLREALRHVAAVRGARTAGNS